MEKVGCDFESHLATSGDAGSGRSSRAGAQFVASESLGRHIGYRTIVLEVRSPADRRPVRGA